MANIILKGPFFPIASLPAPYLPLAKLQRKTPCRGPTATAEPVTTSLPKSWKPEPITPTRTRSRGARHFKPGSPNWNPSAALSVITQPGQAFNTNGSGDGNGENSGPKAQKRPTPQQISALQEVATDLLGYTNLSIGQGNTTNPTAVIWCNTMGIIINPSTLAVEELSKAGINLNLITHVVITNADPQTAEDLLQFIFRRKRVCVVTTPKIYQELRTIICNLVDHDLGLWVDHKPLYPNQHVSLNTDTTIKITDQNDFCFFYSGQPLRLSAIAASPPFSSVRVKPRDIATDSQGLTQYLNDCSLLSHLDEIDIRAIATQGTVVDFAAQDVILKQGDDADCCYIVLSGIADVYTAPDKPAVWSLAALDFFGEIGLQSGNKRNATVSARTPLKAIKISRALYNNIIYNPLRRNEKFNAVRFALQSFVRSIAPDTQLTEVALDSIAMKSAVEDYTDSIREGDEGNEAFILLEGSVGVFRTGLLTPFATLAPGTLFGEMALLNPSARRTASVLTLPGQIARVIRIDRDLFEFILFTYPGLDKGVRDTMRARRHQKELQLARPQIVNTPPEFCLGHRASPPAKQVFAHWRGCCKMFGIDFRVQGISLETLSQGAANIDVLHKLIAQMLGAPLLRQGYLRCVAFHETTQGSDIQYDPANKTLVVSPTLMVFPSYQFAQTLLPVLGQMVAHHLLENELQPSEIATLTKHADTVCAMWPLNTSHALSKAELPVLLAELFGLYVQNGNFLRGLIHSLGSRQDFSSALSALYETLKQKHFLGREYTELPGSAQDFEDDETTETINLTFDPQNASETVLKILNKSFAQHVFDDPLSLYRQLYEPESYHGLRHRILYDLAGAFACYHIQKFTDRLIEVSVYDPGTCTRVIVRAVRVKENNRFLWKVPPEKGLTISHGSPPVHTTLVNLEPPQFSGVKGTPENILTIEASLSKNKPHEASVAIYDCQWGENNVDALVAEIAINTPDVLGVSATFGTLADLKRLLEKLKGLERRPLVVVGGLLSTWSYQHLLNAYPDLLCVRFEGEEVFGQLIDMVSHMPVDNRREFIAQNIEALRNIPNLAFVHDQEIETRPRRFVDLTTVPAPDRTTTAHRFVAAAANANAEHSRGCGYNHCHFCTRTHGWHRSFPLNRCLEDFDSYLKSGVEFVVYVDEDFLADDDPDTAIAFAKEILALKEKYRAEYTAIHHREPVLPSFYIAARATSICHKNDPARDAKRVQALLLLKQAGLVKIFLGGESGASVQFEKTYAKGGSIAEVEAGIERLRNMGIQVVVGFITFDPVMTLGQLEENCAFMERNGLVFVDPLTEPLNPFKFFRAQVGAPLTKSLREIGFLSSTMDPNLLSFDTVYRNPLIRLITQAGTVWRDLTTDLDYHLKGIVWQAEQSPQKMEQAQQFVTLFNKLKQADFELVRALQKEFAAAGRVDTGKLDHFWLLLEQCPPAKI